MTYIIAEPCVDVKDKACVEVCPVDCIHPVDGESVNMLYIDPDECIDCGACEPECPVEAIFAEEDLPEEWNKYIEINAAYVFGTLGKLLLLCSLGFRLLFPLLENKCLYAKFNFLLQKIAVAQLTHNFLLDALHFGCRYGALLCLHRQTDQAEKQVNSSSPDCGR